MLAVDEALHAATEAGKKTTDKASNAFFEAQEKLLLYEQLAHPRWLHCFRIHEHISLTHLDQKN
jgi:hypothetical protein